MHVRLEFEIHRIAHLKRTIGSALVSLHFHMVLGAVQVLLEKPVHQLLLLDPLRDVSSRALNRRKTEAARGVPIQSFKGGAPDGRMSRSIIPILSRAQPIQPFGGARVDETAEEHLETLVDTLRLPVSLRVITCTHAQGDFGQLEELLPK